MPEPTGHGTYTVLMAARCQMVVEVEAGSKAEAERLADALEYDEPGEFEPIDWSKVRVVRGSARLRRDAGA